VQAGEYVRAARRHVPKTRRGDKKGAHVRARLADAAEASPSSRSCRLLSSGGMISAVLCVVGLLHMPAARLGVRSLCSAARPTRPTPLMIFGDEDLEVARKKAEEALAEVKTLEDKAAAAKDEAAGAARNAANAALAARQAVVAAQAAAAAAEADQAAASAELASKQVALDEAASNVASAAATLEAAKEAIAAWEKENPLEAAGKVGLKVGVEVGGAAAATVGNALLTSLFGEPKAVREAKEKAQAEKRAAEAAKAEQVAKEKAGKERIAVEKAAAEAAAEAAAKAKEELAEKARQEEKAAEATRVDEELRRKREEAEQKLKATRARPLTDALSQAAADAALAAAAAATEDSGRSGLGGVASWASEQREKLAKEAAAKEKYSRMALFASDLELLGLRLEDAAELDEAAVRKAFRERSKALHPDARTEDAEGPSVYELNAAYDAIRKLL
jgi:hypothetical protein